MTPGSAINLIEDGTLRGSHVPDVRLSDFREELSNLSLYPELTDELSNLNAGESVTLTVDLISGKLLLIVFDTAMMPSPPGLVGVCARLAENEWLTRLPNFNFYYAISLIDSSAE